MPPKNKAQKAAEAKKKQQKASHPKGNSNNAKHCPSPPGTNFKVIPPATLYRMQKKHYKKNGQLPHPNSVKQILGAKSPNEHTLGQEPTVNSNTVKHCPSPPAANLKAKKPNDYYRSQKRFNQKHVRSPNSNSLQHARSPNSKSLQHVRSPASNSLKPALDTKLESPDDYTYTLDEDSTDGINVIQDDTPCSRQSSPERPKYEKISIESLEDAVEQFGELPVVNPNEVTQQSIQFDRLTTRGRKPLNVTVDDLDQEQIRAAGQRKLVYRDLAMLPATAILPHIVIINMGAVAFFTDLDNRMDVANESNEKRISRVLNNPTSPLFQNASFDWSLRNSQYDVPILSHPSAYYVCVVPSNKFTYGTKSGQSVIGKGKSYFRMIRKRCVEMITINVDECGDLSNLTDTQSNARSFVEMPDYYVEKKVVGNNTIAVQCDTKEKFDEYVRCRLHRSPEDSGKLGKAAGGMPSLVINDPVEDAICRLALHYHATLDVRIPITIVSSKENIMTASTQRPTDVHPLVNILQMLCSGRRVSNVIPRRKEWIDSLCDELQKNCALRGELTLEDMLCLWESPLLRKDKLEAQYANPMPESPLVPAKLLDAPPIPNKDLHPRKTKPEPISLPDVPTPHVIKDDQESIVDEAYCNPISKLFKSSF